MYKVNNNKKENKALVSVDNEYFYKDITSIIKGFAIILMFSLHLLKTEWMIYPELVIDWKINSDTLSSILARGGDICIGIFAFITGYGWASSFEKKKKISRIFGIGGYRTYWIILLLFAFPIRVFMECILNAEKLNLTFLDVLKSITAISSPSIKFGWYIYFFAMLILTFKPLCYLIDKMRVNGWIKIIAICIIAMVLRVGMQFFFSKIIRNEDIYGICSHYFQWIPVTLSGYIVKKEELFDHIYGFYKGKINVMAGFFICIMICSIIYFGKCFFQYITCFYSNIDSFYLPLFMFGLIGVSRTIYKKTKILKLVLEFLGGVSLYLWLMHRILLYEPLQIIILNCRIPIIIVLVSFLIMIPEAILFKLIDVKIDKLIKRLCRCNLLKKETDSTMTTGFKKD